MSKETSTWLNTMTLIGFTEKRGTAWHYRAEDQGDESNHYPGAVPVDDVLRRLFNFEVVERPVYVGRSALREDGSPAIREIPGRKAMVCSDNGDVLGIFKDGYQGHDYKEWLIDSVASILDDTLAIGSAGLLKGRAQAWVQIEVPDSITTPEGVEFRPTILAATSFDGSLSSTYGRKAQLVVCDNTLSAALSEGGQTLKVKHTRYSGLRIADAREALAIVHTMGEEFAAEVARLTAVKVDTNAWEKILDLVIPEAPVTATARSKSLAENKRAEVINLYRNDERVAPWSGTAFGVLQAFNTWQHHVASMKGDKTRAQRNYERAITNVGETFDRGILDAVAQATQHEIGATLA